MTNQAPTRSRLNQARAAIRPRMKGRVMLSGPSGAGKTYTALLIATYLVGPEGRILHIDTEKESSLTYADVFTFEHLRWNAPFDPTELAVTIMEAGGKFDAIIVDSFSHFWRKEGGTLDIAGGKFTGWKDARPRQEDVTEAILETDAHTIVCCRSKMEHVQETDERGRHVVRKIGMKAQQDDDLEYEVNISLEVDMQHVLSVSKSRTAVIPVGTMYQPAHGGDFATKYREWLEGGEPVASKQDTDELAAVLNGIEDPAERHKAKLMFLDAFGRPEFILVSRLAEATEWVIERAAGVAVPSDRAPDQVPGEAAGHEDGDARRAAPEPASAAGDGYQGEHHPFVGDKVLCGQCAKGKAHPAHTVDTGPLPGPETPDPGGAESPSNGSEAEVAQPDPEPAAATETAENPGESAESDAAPTATADPDPEPVDNPGEDAELTPTQRRAEAAQTVGAMKLVAVGKELRKYGETTGGTPTHQREKLINILALRIVCPKCSKLQSGPPRTDVIEDRCECPI